jgi:hypothetical protein
MGNSWAGWLLGPAGKALVDTMSKGGDEGGIKKISTLSPEQQAMLKGLGEYLQSMIGKGATPYTGQQVAPMTGTEQAGMGILNNYVGGGIGETAKTGLGAYNKMMEVDPNQIAANYMKYNAPAEQRYLKDVTIPTFKESMVPGGTLRSTGTERGVGDIVSKFGEGQLTRIGGNITEAQNRAASLIPQLSTMAGIEGGVPQMEAAFQYGQLPRMIEQAELTAKLQEFIRTTPEMSPLIDKMLGYLGIQTQAAYNQPYVPSPFMQFLGAVAPGVGAGVGSYLGSARAAAPAAAAAASDIRLKTNIRKIGKLANGINVYIWKWREFAKKIVGNTPSIGVIAQEVMKIIPKAVFRGEHGYLMVDYSLIS